MLLYHFCFNVVNPGVVLEASWYSCAGQNKILFYLVFSTSCYMEKLLKLCGFQISNSWFIYPTQWWWYSQQWVYMSNANPDYSVVECNQEMFFSWKYFLAPGHKKNWPFYTAKENSQEHRRLMESRGNFDVLSQGFIFTGPNLA